MKTSNLLKTVLMCLLVSQAVATNANATSKLNEVLLTSRKDLLADPYYKVVAVEMTELSEEEALEFEKAEESEVASKNFVGPVLPPRPLEVKEKEQEGKSKSGERSSDTTPKPNGFFEGVIMVVDKLIAIGQKIIPTIEKGKAVVTNNPMSAVSVLPRVDKVDYVVHEMGGWSIPTSKHYKIVYKNGYGAAVVSFVYSITFQHSGKYLDKGDYLTGIRASARNIDVAWGFDLDASSQLIQISNIGTVDNVVAGATIEMSYTVKNWTRQITTNESYFVTGKGQLYKLD